jgi:predicted DNA-binding transcriptional regulator AlpA
MNTTSRNRQTHAGANARSRRDEAAREGADAEARRILDLARLGVQQLTTAGPHSGRSLMSSKLVAADAGGVTIMTLWRWMRDGTFPKPDCVINNRNYWKRETVERWKSKQTATPSTAA